MTTKRARFVYEGVTYVWRSGTAMGSLGVHYKEGHGAHVTIPVPVALWLGEVLSGLQDPADLQAEWQDTDRGRVVLVHKGAPEHDHLLRSLQRRFDEPPSDAQPEVIAWWNGYQRAIEHVAKALHIEL